MLKKLALAAAPLGALGALALGSGVAHAATPTTVTAVTQVSNHQESPLWAYDNFTRTLTVTLDTTSTDCSAVTGFDATFNATADTCYTATVVDKGTSDTIPGNPTPNTSSTAKISHAVQASMNGGASYILFAPKDDVLSAAAVKTAVDDNFGATTAPYATSTWPAAAFLTAAGAPDFANVKVNYQDNGNAWSWTYKTACETWVDSGTNHGGALPGDGNITGILCPTPPPPAVTPYVYGGHVVTVNNNRATVAWSDGGDWPSKNQCVEVWISGYGFGQWNQADPTNPGTSHVGFTCNNGDQAANLGYLSGLAAGHTYALRIVPATGSYGPGNNHPIPGAHVGYVDVFTTR